MTYCVVYPRMERPLSPEDKLLVEIERADGLTIFAGNAGRSIEVIRG